MKTPNVRTGMAALLAVNLLLVAGCNAGSAKSGHTAEDPLAMQPAPPVPQLPPANFEPVPENAGQFVEEATLPSAAFPTADFKPTTNLTDVVKLVRAGVSDNLLRTFITRTDDSFDLGAAGIVYLHDLGLSDEIINLMLQHDNQPSLVAQSTVTIAPPVQPVPDSAPVVVEEQPESPQTVVVVQQPAPVEVNYFYGTLSPYGTWVELDGYGRCWQPTVMLTQRGWQPYSDHGHWVYSSYGWYWVSDYSWGATFHYGRWFNHPSRGWCWVPDNVWGPAWVSWRESSDYCGWAPLPPRANWVAGVGLTFGGSVVDLGFDFGLSSQCYTFVPRSRFADRRLHDHVLGRSQVTRVINNTTIINDYTPARHGGAFNRGIGAENVSAGRRMPDAAFPRNLPSQQFNRQTATVEQGNDTVPATPRNIQARQFPSNQRESRLDRNENNTNLPRYQAVTPSVMPPTGSAATPNHPVFTQLPAATGSGAIQPVVTQPIPSQQIGRGQNGRRTDNPQQDIGNNGRNFPAQNLPDVFHPRVLLNNQASEQAVMPVTPVAPPTIPSPVSGNAQTSPWGRAQNNPQKTPDVSRRAGWSMPNVPAQPQAAVRRAEPAQPINVQPVMPPRAQPVGVPQVMRVQPQPASIPPAPVINMPQIRLQLQQSDFGNAKMRSNENVKDSQNNGRGR